MEGVPDQRWRKGIQERPSTDHLPQQPGGEQAERGQQHSCGDEIFAVVGRDLSRNPGEQSGEYGVLDGTVAQFAVDQVAGNVGEGAVVHAAADVENLDVVDTQVAVAVVLVVANARRLEQEAEAGEDAARQKDDAEYPETLVPHIENLLGVGECQSYTGITVDRP